MSPEEIEEERRQILDRFGVGIGDVLAKAKRLKTAPETRPPRNGISSPLPPSVDIEESRKALQNLPEGALPEFAATCTILNPAQYPSLPRIRHLREVYAPRFYLGMVLNSEYLL